MIGRGFRTKAPHEINGEVTETYLRRLRGHLVEIDSMLDAFHLDEDTDGLEFHVTYGGSTHIGRVGLGHRTRITSANVALSAGWGATPTLSVVAASHDLAGALAVTPGGAGIAASPTITITFSEPFAITPLATLTRFGGTQLTVPVVGFATTTTLSITFPGTPVTAEAIALTWAIHEGASP